MLDVKSWLETTGMKVSEVHFVSPPSYPYIIFIDETVMRGADSKNCIADRTLSIELYSEKINHESETKIETLLNEKFLEYKRARIWIQSEKHFQTVYDFNLTEKV
jgi:hypothetical protein